MVHSGSNNAVARLRATANANISSNTDTFSDGAANPAGGVGQGTMTLSLFANYTVGY